ncbi:MAG: DUF3108 domain-containing protein [Bdellovibrionota bacterium]
MLGIKNISLVTAVFFVAVGLYLQPASAQEDITADKVKISTPVYKPAFDEFTPALGEYKYVTSWQGIPAADLTVTVSRESDKYRVISLVKTYSGIDLFYKLRYRAEGLISAYTLLPERTLINQTENSRVKSTEIIFENGKIRSVYASRGSEPEVLNFDPGNFTLGPFSAAFLARSLRWEVGDVKEFDTYVGKARYLVKLTAKSKTKMELNGKKIPVWEIKPEVLKLTSAKQPGKLRDASIYVTADDKREILQIKSEVFIGNVYTELTEFTPFQRTGDTQLAKAKTQEIRFR